MTALWGLKDHPLKITISQINEGEGANPGSQPWRTVNRADNMACRGEAGGIIRGEVMDEERGEKRTLRVWE